ncbi:M48 family metallopeptidase [Chloroflexota bacterium]
MADSHIINIAGVGLVLFERSIRAKRVIISVKPLKGVRVAIPNRVSLKSALEFVNLKKPWIQKHLVIIKQIESQSHGVSSSVIIDKADAMKKLTSRLHYLAEKHGFTYNKVTIRNQKTRWGSCSHKNNISLNMKLVLLPDELVDYVILHELVHTRIHDHSKSLWAELDKYVGNGEGKAMASRLRKYGGSLL